MPATSDAGGLSLPYHRSPRFTGVRKQDAWQHGWDPACEHRWFVVDCGYVHKNWGEGGDWKGHESVIYCKLCGGTTNSPWQVKADQRWGDL